MNPIDEFHKLFYALQVTSWLGVKLQKNVLDLWIYQQIIFETKPDLIIECGTWHGGSALYLACICDMIGKGQVISIDQEWFPDRPMHNRLHYWQGDALGRAILTKAEFSARNHASVMVILDDDHHKDHVLRELRAYADFVTPGCYLIMEDSNINGNPVYPEFGPGPAEALAEFLPDPRFVVDKSREAFMVTSNPGGFLLRV